ncbi:MAG: NAD-dependent epimerase/dehydratase family protein [Candidatus Heimdallarchaeota archaeon]|nr:NAD-dependent epimerase/dehydratase family protein [Candidatus Heimdallarchaeota archaeon]MCK4954217.1 NAD-dependent epimerase/dehydratase family protein [Candidatus Heimdallarchaeota archaeon]
MVRILVTGATGCTGNGVLKYLIARSYQDVKALVRKEPEESLPNVEYITGDITDKKRMKEILDDNGINSIWHMAAAVHRSVKKTEYIPINRDGTQNLLEAAANSGIECFNYTSTTGVYGKIKDTPVKENHRIKPWGVYTKSKLEAEQIIKNICDETGIHGGILRLPMILGKGDRHTYPIIGKLIKINIMPIVGKPDHRISIVHPFDVGRALELLTENKTKELDIYNLVSCNVTFKELVLDIEKYLVGKKRFKYPLPYPIFFMGAWAYEAIQSIIASKEPIVNREYAQMVGREWVFDTSKIEKIGYKPLMDKDSILKDLVLADPIPVPLKKEEVISKIT